MHYRKPTKTKPNPCLEPDNFLNSVIALDLDTGELKWAKRSDDFDAYVVGCLDTPPVKNCPPRPGPDLDFPQAPMYLSLDSGLQVVVAGQKSGLLWAFHPDNGTILWSTFIGPGGLEGGLMWGSASDEERIYVQSANYGNINHTIPMGLKNLTINYGSWAAVDPTTGMILWQTPSPMEGRCAGPMTVGNGVVYASIEEGFDLRGYFYALNGSTGEPLWSFNVTNNPFSVSGPAVVDGVLYWGSDQFYAFAVED